MKKLFIVLMAALAVASVSCKKDNEPKLQKRLVMCGDEWDKYYFTYGADGKITDVKRNPDENGDWERTWTFTWNGNKASVKYIKEGEEQSPLSITLGSNGFVSSFTDTWGDVRNCTYDQEGHLLKVLKGSDPKCNCVWENGDLKKWSRFSDGEEQYKIQAFYADENLGGIFADATDKAGIDRWMIEIGLFGKPSKHLLKNAVWEGSESVAELEYEKDADNYVVKATKYYGGEVDQTFEYKWETIKK